MRYSIAAASFRLLAKLDENITETITDEFDNSIHNPGRVSCYILTRTITNLRFALYNA